MLLRILRSISKAFQHLEDGVLVSLVATLVIIAVGQILARALLSLTFSWSEPLIRHLVLWVGFLGGMIATRQGKHLRIDIAVRLLSPGKAGIIERITALTSAVVCFLLTWISVQFVIDERAFATISFLGIPSWPLQLIFPFAFVVMGLRFLRESVDIILPRPPKIA